MEVHSYICEARCRACSAGVKALIALLCRRLQYFSFFQCWLSAESECAIWNSFSACVFSFLAIAGVVVL